MMRGHWGHRVVGRSVVRGLRQELELLHGGGSLPMRGAQAVGAGVSAAQDYDVLAARRDEFFVRVLQHLCWHGSAW